MAKMTIYVPDELRNRMKATYETVNWSQLAQRAFEDELQELMNMQDPDDNAHLADHNVCIADELKKAHSDWIQPQAWMRCGCAKCKDLLRMAREMFAPKETR